MSTPVVYINQTLWTPPDSIRRPSPRPWRSSIPWCASSRNAPANRGLCYEVNEWLPQSFIQNAGGDVIDADGKPVMDSRPR